MRSTGGRRAGLRPVADGHDRDRVDLGRAAAWAAGAVGGAPAGQAPRAAAAGRGRGGAVRCRRAVHGRRQRHLHARRADPARAVHRDPGARAARLLKLGLLLGGRGRRWRPAGGSCRSCSRRKYSFNFLPYIEQAATTTATMSAATFLRGQRQLDRLPQPGTALAERGLGGGDQPGGDHRGAIAAGDRAARDRSPGSAERRLAAALPAVSRPWSRSLGYPGALGGPFHSHGRSAL